MHLKWEPKGDQIFVRPLLPPDATSSGLLIPDQARARPQRGVVLAVGPGLPAELTGNLRPMGVVEGNLVMFGEFAGMRDEINGEEIIVMRAMETLGAVAPDGYELEEHEDVRGRKLYHLKGEVCEHCPKAATPALDEERARLREANAAELQRATPVCQRCQSNAAVVFHEGVAWVCTDCQVVLTDEGEVSEAKL